MTDTTTTPSAPATLVRGRTYWLWRVRSCPHCGREHTHGGGAIDGDPRRLLGHRVAHCWAPGGYVLVESGEGTGGGG